MNPLEAVLRHERAFIMAALAALTALAWLYVWQGAGMGMTALAMTQAALFPHLTPEPMPGMVMAPIAWTTVVLMWWVMMVAMMTPSAAPLVLLYGRVLRHAAGQGQSGASIAPSFFLAGGYLLVWLAFSIAATVLLYVLQRAGLVSQMMLWSQNAILSAAVLAGAGIYQFTPLRNACLAHCRSPMQFLTRHMRTGNVGAMTLGIEHGAWCVGCCWLLMSLLFVFGVMNLLWIALLAVLVQVERLAPRGVLVSRLIGVILIGWSIATLLA